MGDEYVTANILSIIYIKYKIDGFLIKKCVDVISGAYTSIRCDVLVFPQNIYMKRNIQKRCVYLLLAVHSPHV